MKNHSLKEGMTLVKPTESQFKIIKDLAITNNIRTECEFTQHDIWLNVMFNDGELMTYHETSKCDIIVTFEQFITAMVAPESEETVTRNGNVNEPINAAVETLQAENEALKKRLAELEPKVDRRVDFGKSVTFNLNASGNAFIAHGCANDGDSGKVLIPNYKCKWELLPNYYDGRDAVQLVKTN